MHDLIYKQFQDYNIILTDEQVKKFRLYYELLIEWNEKINLTAITEYSEVIKKHFLDSCLLLKEYNEANFKEKSIIDIGTGAGFPGIPLAILLSDTSFTLVDSLNKRIDFLKIVTEKLGLTNVTLYHGRAEDFGKNKDFREKYDYCVSRAVAALPLLLEYCSPFIVKNGSLLLYKSKKVSQEIEEASNALSLLNCIVSKNIQLVDEDDFERYILQIDKVDNTPDKYPRKAGKPKKKPL